MQEIQLIFNAGKGSVSLSRITAVCGDRVGALPTPVRKGYVFGGWFLSPDGNTERDSAKRVTADTVLDPSDFGGVVPDEAILYARFEKIEKSGKTRKKSSLRAQKRAVCIMLCAVVLCGVLLGAVKYIVSIYHFEDFDGQTYTVRKKDGEYGLYDGKTRCDINDDGYYMTGLGTQLSIDKKTGEYRIYAVVDTSGTEEVGAGQRVLMFKQLTYDASSTKDQSKIIRKFEIHNQHGKFVLNRPEKGNSNRFQLEGHEGTLLFDQLFAQLSVGCGYTISMQRLEHPVRLPDGSIDYREYGLAPERRPVLDEKGEEVKDENGQVTMYDYTPSWYNVTTMTNDVYHVTLGDATVSEAGYYARYGDRDTIYILSSTNLDAAVLQPVETLIAPMIVFPMSLNTYFNVENFVYRSDVDYDGILRDLVFELTGFDLQTVKPDENGKWPEEATEKIEETQKKMEEMEEKDFTKLYQGLIESNSRIVTAFSFVDMESREDTLFSYVPYRMSSEYMAGYFPHSDNIGQMLQLLYSMTFEKTVAIGPDDDTMEKYNLSNPAHLISFIYRDAEGHDFSNSVSISEKTKDGKYYAYSDNFDMIVCFSESQAPYLEWKEIDWYEREYFPFSIMYAQEMTVESPLLSEAIHFELSSTDEKTTVVANGKEIDYKLMVTKPSGSRVEETASYNFRRLFQSFLTASMEGSCELTEEEMAAMRAKPDSECRLKYTVIMDDGKGNTRYAVYRFYQYTERKAYLTIEVLDSPDQKPDPTKAQGHFFVLRSFCDKIIADTERFLAGEEVTPDSKK